MNKKVYILTVVLWWTGFRSYHLEAFEVTPSKILAGSVSHGKTIEANIQIFNNDNQALVWVGTHSSCGCEASEISKSKLKHGESAVLKIKFHTEGFLGKIEKDISLMFLDEKNKTVSNKVHLEVLITSTVQLDPPVILFSFENRDKPQVTKVKNYSHKITLSEIPSHLAVAELEPGLFEVRPQLDKLADDPRLVQIDKIRFTDSLTQDYFYLMVRSDVHPRPFVDNTPLDLGSLKFKEEKVMHKQLSGRTNTDQLRVEISKAYLNSAELPLVAGGIEAAIENKKKSVKVKIRNQSPDLTGHLRVELLITDTSDRDRKYTFSAYAYFQKGNSNLAELPEATPETETTDE